MIHAICLNKHCLEPDTYARILESISGIDGGVMGEVSNGIASFPNGYVYKCYIPPALAARADVYNCHDDIEKFIEVNSFGIINKLKQNNMETSLKEKSYEELVQLQQDKEITLLQFVEAQEDLSEDWKNWLQSHPRDDESASAFLNEIEKNLY